MSIKFHEGDSYKVLKDLHAKGTRVASVVTDPPYGLTSIVKRFGEAEAKKAKYGKDGAFGRVSKGFMGQKWDASGVERDPAFWKLVFDLVLPGGYIVAFSSARTYHHMAVAIEAAGFVSHPMIGWAYASGMAKPHHPHVEGFEGYCHGAQVRKPALEPIYVGQKPYDGGSVSANLRIHGVGAVNIKGIDLAGGRWPANLITDGSDEVGELFPRTPGQKATIPASGVKTARVYGTYARDAERAPRGDVGSAMRFFEIYPFDGRPLFYHGKATKEDRAGSEHATVKPIGLMRALVRHVTPPGTTVLDPFAGTGTTGIAALREGREAILIEANEVYARDIRNRLLTLTPGGSSYFKALGIEER